MKVPKNFFLLISIFNPACNNCSFILNGAFEDFYSLKIDELVSHYVGEEAIHSTTM